ncbi:DNA primase [Dysgonomonas sp. PFB1-18]|uniref:DNA primase n=1 Tax=unclassified Dysgonomonas TaxID=2630389 RepID=UPI002475B19F|nr:MULTISPECIES: DNA primase [unclassified Dysgonomonas]MDH6309884.1 DNA primase [Dysgonomonas sp. PF1-14]MDH6339428.1 DNA primase [Dysgonomonas sp. PF1-16]MDH6380927.1 DNA primase [Dysgonomonas sp. PFB1-18]MDH6397936.1 DNA primase [Dysgonomonas sp. PF1-23]
MIDQGTIDRIIDTAQIVDVVSQFVTLKRRGINYVGLCPFHEDRSPSFYVSPAKNICKCFACGEGGTAVHFIMKHEQLSYFDSLRFLAKKYNIEIQERELTDEQKQAYNERESLFILNDYARDYFKNTLHEHIEGKSVGLSYFKERGFREDIVEKFQLGYSLEQRDAFTQEALKNGYKKEYLVKTGLTIENENNNALIDRFRGRVMFPVHTLSGKVIAFGGRILRKAENTGKYINSPESEIYHKGNELYGIYFAKQAITKADCCFLVEGYTDVISMHQAGVENVVSSSGTALTHGQIRLIHRFTNNVTVIYDGDAAGIKAALRGIDLLLEDGMNIKVVLLPDGEDPDSFARKQNAGSFNDYIKQHEVDFIRFKTKLLIDEAGNDPIKRATLISDIVSSISVIPDNIIRTVYIKDCSILLDIDERILVQEVTKKRLAYLERTAPQKAATEMLAVNNDLSQPVIHSKVEPKSTPIDKFELAILYYIVRFGMEMLTEEGEPDNSIPMNVIDYVKFDLERDELWFTNPLYAKILDDAVERRENPDFVPSRYFLAHQDPEVSKIAAELLNDRYQLSKVHIKQFGENLKEEDTPLAEDKHLTKNVPRVLTELKDAYISKRIRYIKDQMAEKQKDGNLDEAIALMQQIKELEEIKKALAKVLGERIILRW